MAAARGALARARVGHAGTLDPFATGLLVLLIGRATRLAEYVSALDKTYRAALRLDASSTTGDPEGEITQVPRPSGPPSEDELREALAGFIGEQDQLPPLYSAKRVGGERAYRLARRSAAFTLAPSRVRIERIELLGYDYPTADLRVVTGPGTYVRGLARDIGEALESAAYLTALRREAVGPFRVDEAVDVRGLTGAAIGARILPAEAAVAHLPGLELDGETARALCAGRRPSTADLGNGRAPAGLVRLLAPAGFLGVGEVEPLGLRPVKILYPERATT